MVYSRCRKQCERSSGQLSLVRCLRSRHSLNKTFSPPLIKLRISLHQAPCDCLSGIAPNKLHSCDTVRLYQVSARVSTLTSMESLTLKWVCNPFWSEFPRSCTGFFCKLCYFQHCKSHLLFEFLVPENAFTDDTTP